MHLLLLYRDLNRPGGVPSDVQALCGAMLADGHEVTAVAASPNGDDGVTDRVTRSLRLDKPSDVVRLRRALRVWEFDAAYLLPLLHPWNAAMRTFVAQLDVPLCVAPMGHAVSPHILAQRFGGKRHMPLNRRLKSLHLRIVDRPLLERASLVRALSPWEAGESTALGAGRCLLLPEGFPERSELPRDGSMHAERSRTTVFGYLGRLAATQKGLDLLVPAARIVADELGGEAFQVVVAGPSVDGFGEVLQREARHANLRNIVVLGPVSESGKQGFWQQCDYFLHFSRYETMARAVREAVSGGLPVLASRESNTGDWAAEEGFGYRVALTPVSIAEAMIAACTAAEDTHASMRSHALEFAGKWTWSHVAREFVRGFSHASH